MTTHAKSAMSAKKVAHLGSARTTKTRRPQAPAIPQQHGQGEETLPDGSWQTGHKHGALSNRLAEEKPATKSASTDAYAQAHAHTGPKSFAADRNVSNVARRI